MAVITTISHSFTEYADGIQFSGKATADAFDLPIVFQGTVSGYTSGGGPGQTNVIDKFPFASDANATDVGDLTQARQGGAGQQV